MDLKSIALVFAGAGSGGVARYLMNLSLNPLFIPLPLGTLAANVLGSGAAGLMLGLIGARAHLAITMNPLVVSGFLGGLTTFSTFSAEVVRALDQQRLALAAGIIAIHVCASVGAALAGLAGARALLS